VANKKARRERRQSSAPARKAAAVPEAAQAPEPASRQGDVLKIDEPVICRVLTHPKGYAPFLQFCCGKDRQEEGEVLLTIHNLFAGTTETQQIAVLLERDAPRLKHTEERPLVGVATIATAVAEQAFPGVKSGDRGALIGVIGTDLDYRKHVLSDGKTRPGVELVRGTLKLIEQMFGGAMPFVRTNVLPTNEGSRPLFDEHGFEDMGRPMVINQQGEKKRAANLALFRPAGMSPTLKRRRTWSK
jgi:hypothetical protein